MEQGLGQLWVQCRDLGAISRIVSRFFGFFELAPSLYQRLDPSRLVHTRDCPEPMQVLPERVAYRPSPEQPLKSGAYRRASKWSHRIFHQRLSLPFFASCERCPTDGLSGSRVAMLPAIELKGEPMSTARIRWLSAAAAVLAIFGSGVNSAKAEDTIKIGILHSLSGTMAISETILKDLILMEVAEVNAKGGLLGKKIEPVVVDPASNWPLFAEKARELLTKDKVAAVFGCWTSVSRKSVLPVFEELNGLLFYPLEYEGEEASYNIFYGSSVPDNKAVPAVEYLMSKEGGDVRRFVLEGTDYVYPRTSNKIIRAFLKTKGVKDEDILENYTPFGFSDWQTEVAAIKKFGSSGKKTAVISTVNGDANVPFYKELGNQGMKATDIPVIAFSVGEEELAGLDTKPLVGHLAAWSYFQSVNTPENKAFIAKWRAYTKNPKRVTNDPMESAYILFHMWVQAVQQAGTTDVEAVRQAMIGQKVKSPSGFEVVMGSNHHMAKPVMIGEVQADGQFNIVYKSKALPPKAWSPYVEANKGKVADWSWPWVCGGCTSPRFAAN
jgi:urea transport system substrate-binding protein